MSAKSHALSVDVHDASRLDAMTEAELDALPVGAIRVDADGRILYYSRAQASLTGRAPQQVLGRHFFRDVAPCTAVPEFYGRFRRGVLTGALNTSFEFIYDFAMQPVRVRIHMRDAERAGEYWVVVSPLEYLPARARARPRPCWHRSTAPMRARRAARGPLTSALRGRAHRDLCDACSPSAACSCSTRRRSGSSPPAPTPSAF
jgi:photoactive yellow protein